MKSSLEISKHWTFRNRSVAKHFNDHVREQLPWYDLATQAVALVIVDKVQMPPGYAGTAFSRLTLQQKLAAGAPPEAILRKELSLAGYQRPLDPGLLPQTARAFFQMGEFVGWIIEKEESAYGKSTP